MKRMKTFVLVILVILLSGVGWYSGSEALFLYRTNQVIKAVLEVQNNPSGLQSSAPIQQLCKPPTTASDGHTLERAWECAQGGILHPYLRTIALETISQNGDRILHTTGIQTVLPRRELGPLTIFISRELTSPGSLAKVRPIPNRSFHTSLDIVLQCEARTSVKLKYACAVPLVNCTTYIDFVTIR